MRRTIRTTWMLAWSDDDGGTWRTIVLSDEVSVAPLDGALDVSINGTAQGTFLFRRHEYDAIQVKSFSIPSDGNVENKLVDDGLDNQNRGHYMGITALPDGAGVTWNTGWHGEFRLTFARLMDQGSRLAIRGITVFGTTRGRRRFVVVSARPRLLNQSS